MAVYTVFEPPRHTGDAAQHGERFVFIRDRFSWSAFLFAPLWMLRHRLWLVLLGYIVVIAAVTFGLMYIGVGANERILVMALIHLLIGCEAADLRRWTLIRRGWRELGTVIGDDLEAAERRFFDAWVTREEERPAPSSNPSATNSRRAGYGSDIIGLFPEPGASR